MIQPPSSLNGYLDKIPPENAAERELVPTRVLNPNASEASYKPKQRSYRKTKLNFFFFFFHGDFIREPLERMLQR